MDELEPCKILHEKGRKFWVPDKSFPSLFLPSTKAVFKLLGIPHSLPLILESIESQYGLESNLTRSIKNKMVKTGVSDKHRDSYYNFVKQVLPDGFLSNESELIAILNRSNSVASNAGAWLNAIEGYCHSNGRFKDLDQPIVDFLKTRAYEDLIFLEKSKKHQISHENNITQTKWVCEFIRLNTLVPKETIGDYLHSVSKIHHPGDYSSFEHEDVLNILRFKISCEIDFFFSAIAVYDTSIKRAFPELNLRHDYQQILLIFAEEDDVRTLTESLLSIMKEYSEPSLSWSSLANHISCAEPRATLNKWRKGKENPSNYQFRKLIESLSLDSDVERFVIGQYFKISILFDKLVKEWLDLAEKILLESRQENIIVDESDRKNLIKSIFFQVKDYYESFGVEGHQP